jgi:MFS family permease
MIIFGLNNTPTIASSFLGPLIAQAFYENINFRWAYGSLAIVLVGVCLPPLVIMLWEQRKAYRNGTLERKPKSGRSILQSFKYYSIEFDGTFRDPPWLALSTSVRMVPAFHV